MYIYLATLLNSFTSSNSFCAETLGLSMSIMSSTNSESFTFFLTTWIPFTSFSCLIAVDSSSNTMFNRSSESGHYYLIPKFSRKAFSFLALSTMMAVGLS